MSGPYPLPVSPFEFAMLADDRPSHPMTFGVRLSFEGHIDFDRFCEAFRTTAERHPRLVGRIDGLGAKRPAGVRWVTAVEDITCERGPLPARPRPIDLGRGPGVRLTASEDGAVLLEFHHACADGLGILCVLEEVFGLPISPMWPGTKWDVDYLFALRRTGAFFRSRPRPLTVPPGTPAGDMAWHRATLTESETLAVREAAKKLGGTVNDLIVCELFHTLESWNAALGRAGGVHRVCVPMSTRVGAPADSANAVTMVTLDRIVRRTNGRALLRSVAAEMALVRAQRRTHSALLVLDVLGQVPGGIAAVYAPSRCQATAVASNLGVAFGGRAARFGAATLRDMHFLPPVRLLTRLAVAVLTYDGRLCLGAATDPTALSVSDGRRLFDGHVSRLRGFAAGRAL